MKRANNIFFTSDWHVGHKNILEFSKRPFRDLTHMHEALINNFNSCVRDEDITYFGGDMGLCNAETLYDVVMSLNGTKILILGNHDKNTQAMLSLGFDAAMYSATLYIANKRVTISHCPLKGVLRENTEGMKGAQPGENWHGETKNNRFTVSDEGQYHLHGHIHSPNSGKSQKILDRQYDIGVDANNYRPVSISTIESWIAKTEQEKLK